MIALLSILVYGLIWGIFLVIFRAVFSERGRYQLFVLSAQLASVASWSLSVALINPVYGREIALDLARISFVMASLSVVGMIMLVDAFIKPHKHMKLVHVFFVASVLAIMLVAKDFIVPDVSIIDGIVSPMRGVPYTLFLIIIGCMVTFSLIRLYKYAYFSRDSVREDSRYTKSRSRLKLLANVLLVSVLCAIVTNVVLPNLYNNVLPARWSGMVAVLTLSGVIYSSLKYKLFDIKATAVRTLAYILSLSVMAGIYFGIAYVVSSLLLHDRAPSMASGWTNITLALILAIVFQPIKRFFDKVTNSIFYRDQYDPNELVARLGKGLKRSAQLCDILDFATNEIASTLKASGAKIIVYRQFHENECVGGSGFFDTGPEDYELLRGLERYMTGRLYVIDREAELPHAPKLRRIVKMLAEQHVSVVLRLQGADNLVGYLLLGDQLSNGYVKRDLQVLETIADELVIAIQHARSVQVIRDLNTHLEQRVKTATRQLRRSNQRLMELDATKDEFVSMASHQLRTPLTSIKGYISMVLEGDAGPVNDAQRQLLGEAFTSSERMVHLIGDFLNVSRLQNGKFVIDRKPVDLAELTLQEVEGMQQIAASHGIPLTVKVPKRFPRLYLDEGKLQQVIMNYIDNAIYYSPESTPIHVELTIEDGDAVLRVTDHGIGVSDEEKQRLFTKFFRAKNARTQRPDGTGIGLYLAKRVISGHHGTPIFTSQLGKGSTFGFRLPIRELSELKKSSATSK